MLDLVFSGEFFGDAGITARQSYAYEVMKRNFPTWKLSKVKDTAHQGCLNLNGLEQI